MKIVLTIKNERAVESGLTNFLKGDGSRAAAATLKGLILARSQAGVAYDGTLFKPYTKQTIAQRAKLGLSTTRVTLMRTGAMLHSLYWSSGDRMLAPSAEQMAKSHGNQIRWGRPFVGHNKADNPLIIRSIVEAYK